jgi:hypothetical protein
MANKVTFPDGGSGWDMMPPGTLIVGTTPNVTPPLGVEDADGLSLHLVVDYQVDGIALNVGTDAVVASTGVWTFTNYTFTGLTGAKLVIANAANAGNNGTFAISSVSGHTATTATTGLVNETFGPNVTVSVIRSETASHPAGTWTVTASNDYISPGTSKFGHSPNPGHFATVTTMFYLPAPTPAAIAAVTDAGSQYVQASPHFDGGTIQVTFTPSAGLGTPRVYVLGKSWSR